jgi:hypothetical protein
MILPVQIAWRFVPSMVGRKRYNEDGVIGLHRVFTVVVR